MARGNEDSLKKAMDAADEALAKMQEALKGWRPRFGNADDIALTQRMGRIGEMKEELRKKRLALKGGEKLANDLTFAVNGVLYALEQHNKNGTPLTVPEIPADASGEVRGEAD